jgi:hypothetical protein
MIKPPLLFILLVTFVSACSGRPTPAIVVQTPIPATPTYLSPSPSSLPAITATTGPVPSATPSLVPDAWMQMPVVPDGVSPRVRAIYLQGQQLGNNPNAFSKIGDCESTPSWFLGDFDLGPANYSLGPYTDLQPVIDQFHGSFGRTSLAAGRGYAAATVLSPLWADPKLCQAGETPLTCELRLNKPAFAFVMLGTNDASNPAKFEGYMRQILDALIQRVVVPILATKADNLERDHSLNATIARLAYEYEIPLWNYWLVVQPLPEKGLQPDLSHLTFAPNRFDNPIDMQAAWPWRNLTALQVINAVRKGINGQP